MRRINRLGFTLLAALLPLCLAAGSSESVLADTANSPSLVISQLKITSSSGQFVTLYNTTASPLDMSKYQLEYFNNYDLGKATSSRLIALSGIVPPHGYFMVNDSSLMLCYQLTIDSVSLGFASTTGLVEVLSNGQSAVGAAATPSLQDYVGWSKTPATGAQTLPANTSAWLQRQPVDSSNNPVVTGPGTGSWQAVQPDATNPCKIVTAATSTPLASGLNQLLPVTEPPAEIVSLSEYIGDAPSTPIFPTADIGLISPRITELLPNPEGIGNDSTDEFIEVFNPNPVNFDLSGFVLQSGTTTTHDYVFQAGTSLPPNSFTAFYSEQTGLSLSNTKGMVKLLDPFGNSLSATPAYANAKDGQAWALADGKWLYTTSPTPGASNVIKQPITPKKKSSSAKSTKSSSAKSTKSAKPITASSSQTSGPNSEPSTTPIHFGVLALVIGLALLYGLYEYRADLANRIYQLREYLKARRASRAEA